MLSSQPRKFLLTTFPFSMKKLGLKKRLVAYLEKRPQDWVHSGTLQELTEKHTDQMPRTAVRRLQEAVEDGLIEVKYEKGSALYRSTKEPAKPKPTYQITTLPNGERVARMV